MGQFAEFITGCARGRGGIGIISGGVGLGKTALLRAVSEQAVASGYTVLSAVGSAAEQAFPYGVLEQLMHSAPLDGQEAEHLLTLHDRTAEWAESPSRGSVKVMRDVHQMLVELTKGGPVLISVDDVQYADGPSLQCLLYLMRRCRSMPVAIIVTQGTDDTAASQTMLRELLCRPWIPCVKLGPLSQDGVYRMVAGELGDAAAQRLTPEYAAASSGNPLLLRALLHDQALHGEPGPEAASQLTGGYTFRQAVAACTHRAGPNALKAARGIAVLGGAKSVAVLSRLIELDDRTTASAVHVLTESRLVDALRFRHPGVQAAVLGDLPSQDAMHLHQRAAGLLRDEGASSMTVARHLLATGPVREDWVTPVLREAAEQSLADDQVSFAARCLHLADSCCVDETERHAIKTMLISLMRQHRPDAWTRHLQTLVSPAKGGHLPPATSLDVVRGLLWRGSTHDAAEIMEQVFSADGSDSRLDFELYVIRLWLTTTFPGWITEQLSSLGPPADQPKPAPLSAAPRATAYRALWTTLRRGADDSVVAAAEQVLQSVPMGNATVDAIEAAILALVYADRLNKAARWCDRFLGDAANQQGPTWKALLSSLRALIALRQGDLVAAADKAQDALSYLSPEAWGVGIGLPLATLIEARTAMGQHERAAELVNRPVPEAMFMSRFGLHFLYARGRHQLARGHHDAALADFLACGERMRSWDLDSPTLAPWRGGAAEAWLRLNKRERAAQIAHEQLSLADRGRPRTHGVALRVLAATRTVAQQPELLNQALEVLQATGDRYETARTLADLGRTILHRGDVGKARLIVRRAWHLAKECGAEELCYSLLPKPANGAKTAAAENPQADAKPPGLLSDAEMRVTSLAAQGYTNREISGKLFITVSTVEQHLTRAYRKLNIRHRQELPTSLELHAANTATA